MKKRILGTLLCAALIFNMNAFAAETSQTGSDDQATEQSGTADTGDGTETQSDDATDQSSDGKTDDGQEQGSTEAAGQSTKTLGADSEEIAQQADSGDQEKEYISLPFSISHSLNAEESEGAYTIIAGKAYTLTITVKNNSTDTTAYNVTVLSDATTDPQLSGGNSDVETYTFGGYQPGDGYSLETHIDDQGIRTESGEILIPELKPGQSMTFTTTGKLPQSYIGQWSRIVSVAIVSDEENVYNRPFEMAENTLKVIDEKDAGKTDDKKDDTTDKTKDDSKDSAKGDAPKTGDTSSVFVFVCLAGVALIAVIVILVIRNKRKK